MEYTTISKDEANKLYTEIFLYGKQMQTDVAIEEMGELIQALVKYRRKESEENRKHIVEEIADVQIMLDQLKLMYDSYNEAEKMQAYKQARLLSRMDEELKKNL